MQRALGVSWVWEKEQEVDPDLSELRSSEVEKQTEVAKQCAKEISSHVMKAKYFHSFVMTLCDSFHVPC